jgi:5'-nucleotidase
MDPTLTVLLTNDDGYGAPGLEALRALIGPTALVVAPRHPQSGCSHLVTMDRPIGVEQVGPQDWRVDGTPGDCVRIALRVLGCTPALVLSGINEGGNLGHDVYLSGTVAAAREAAILGVPSVSISQYFRAGEAIDWPRAAGLARQALDRVLSEATPQDGFWNVNLPPPGDPASPPSVVECQRCIRPLHLHYVELDGAYQYERGHYHRREQRAGTDVAACFGGDIALTWETL